MTQTHQTKSSSSVPAIDVAAIVRQAKRARRNRETGLVVAIGTGSVDILDRYKGRQVERGMISPQDTDGFRPLLGIDTVQPQTRFLSSEEVFVPDDIAITRLAQGLAKSPHMAEATRELDDMGTATTSNGSGANGKVSDLLMALHSRKLRRVLTAKLRSARDRQNVRRRQLDHGEAIDLDAPTRIVVVLGGYGGTGTGAVGRIILMIHDIAEKAGLSYTLSVLLIGADAADSVREEVRVANALGISLQLARGYEAPEKVQVADLKGKLRLPKGRPIVDQIEYLSASNGQIDLAGRSAVFNVAADYLFHMLDTPAGREMDRRFQDEVRDFVSSNRGPRCFGVLGTSVIKLDAGRVVRACTLEGRARLGRYLEEHGTVDVESLVKPFIDAVTGEVEMLVPSDAHAGIVRIHAQAMKQVDAIGRRRVAKAALRGVETLDRHIEDVAERASAHAAGAMERINEQLAQIIRQVTADAGLLVAALVMTQLIDSVKAIATDHQARNRPAPNEPTIEKAQQVVATAGRQLSRCDQRWFRLGIRKAARRFVNAQSLRIQAELKHLGINARRTLVDEVVSILTDCKSKLDAMTLACQRLVDNSTSEHHDLLTGDDATFNGEVVPGREALADMARKIFTVPTVDGMARQIARNSPNHSAVMNAIDQQINQLLADHEALRQDVVSHLTADPDRRDALLRQLLQQSRPMAKIDTLSVEPGRTRPMLRIEVLPGGEASPLAPVLAQMNRDKVERRIIDGDADEVRVIQIERGLYMGELVDMKLAQNQIGGEIDDTFFSRRALLFESVDALRGFRPDQPIRREDVTDQFHLALALGIVEHAGDGSYRVLRTIGANVPGLDSRFGIAQGYDATINRLCDHEDMRQALGALVARNKAEQGQVRFASTIANIIRNPGKLVPRAHLKALLTSLQNLPELAGTPVLAAPVDDAASAGDVLRDAQSVMKKVAIKSGLASDADALTRRLDGNGHDGHESGGNGSESHDRASRGKKREATDSSPVRRVPL